MSKTTLAIIASVSALSGAAATVVILSSRERKSTANFTGYKASSSAAPQPTLPTLPLPRKHIDPPVDPSGLLQYGFPGPTADIHSTPSTLSCFDRRTRNPHWVIEHITPASLAMNEGNRRHSYFVEDETVPEKYRAKLTDYFRSGYDRGHQVPAADAKWSQDAMDSTFLLTNMCPQVGDGFNRDYWAHFEDFCRRLTHRYPSVRIVTGPLYLPRRDPADGKWRVLYEVIGNPANISVPTHFFKVIFGEDGRTGGNVALGAFVLPNAVIANDKPLQSFEVPVEAVERATGLEFAAKLPPQRKKRLCADVDCSLIVRQYEERQGNLMGRPPDRPRLSAPSS